MLGGFLEEAQAEQAALAAAQAEAEAAVRATVGWLGEAPELDPAPTFEMCLKFCADFDHALRKMVRAQAGGK